jgi:hypothetical protein
MLMSRGVNTWELDKAEIRALFQDYLAIVRRRVALERRIRLMTDPVVLKDLLRGFKQAEEARLKLLERWVKHSVTGKWLLEVRGIGPVVATGLLAHVDLRKMTKVESLWKYAGLEPKAVKKGRKTPWHPTLKAVAYWAGESFIRSRNHPGSFYGPLYVARRAYEQEQNNQGRLKAEAERTLRRGYRWRAKTREIYESGMLPPAHLTARARRWTVKLFLSHFYEILLWEEKGRIPEQEYRKKILPPHDPRGSTGNPGLDYRSSLPEVPN